MQWCTVKPLGLINANASASSVIARALLHSRPGAEQGMRTVANTESRSEGAMQQQQPCMPSWYSTASHRPVALFTARAQAL